jgi:Xaa-Pro dipeptidase
MAAKNNPKERRDLLASELRSRGTDWAIISHPKHVFYLTGIPTNLNAWYSVMKGPRSTSALALDSEGRAALLAGRSELAGLRAGMASDPAGGLELGITEYVDYSLSGDMVTYGRRFAAEMNAWLGTLGPKFGSVAIEEWHLADAYRSALLSAHPEARLVGISEFILGMRNSKGIDEVESLEKATGIVDRSYGAAKGAAKPGKTELDVYTEVNSWGFRKHGPFGTVVGDIVSGGRSLAMGGIPTRRKLKSGDTIILDLQASYGNYWSDLCRTFVIGRKPNKAQQNALSVLKRAKAAGEETLIPGTKGKEVYEAVCSVLQKAGHQSLPHHAGHGIGLDDQEPPWFTPGEERSLEEGSVCVLEPGIYRKDSGGMRIEDQYVVTSRGPRKLSRFPLAIS